MDKKSVIEKIQKLMDLAQDQEGLPEGETALRIAREMMLKYSIEDLSVKGSESPCLEKFFDFPKKQMWVKLLLTHVAEHLECKCLFYTKVRAAVLYGFKRDIEMAMFLFEYLLEEVNRKAKEFYKKHLKPDVDNFFLSRGDATRERNDFVASMVRGIGDRLAKQRQQEEGTYEEGLILQKREVVEDFYASKRGPVRTRTSRGRAFSQDGYSAGMQVDLKKGYLQ